MSCSRAMPVKNGCIPGTVNIPFTNELNIFFCSFYDKERFLVSLKLDPSVVIFCLWMFMCLSHQPSVLLVHSFLLSRQTLKRHVITVVLPEGTGEGESSVLHWLTCTQEQGREAEWQGGVTCKYIHRDYEQSTYLSGFAVAIMPWGKLNFSSTVFCHSGESWFCRAVDKNSIPKWMDG